MAASDFENRPRTRQRKFKPAPSLEVPNIEENAAERKRVLNVLAQRRYRQRKRQTRHGSSGTERGPGGDGLEDSCVHEGAISESATGAHSLVNNENPDRTAGLVTETPITSPQDMDFHTFLQAVQSMPINMGNFMTESPIVRDLDALPFYPSNSLFFESSDAHASSMTATTNSPPFLTQWSDSQVALTSSSTSTATTPPTESFPDSYLLPMSELTLLRALLRIATRLNAHAVWDMTANSPFNCDANADISWTLTLPSAWQPTALQRTTPHHPLIDLLPWPAVRDKMISMLFPTKSTDNISNLESDQEEALSPKPSVIQCSEDSGIPPLVGFIYDMEDGAEGIRIWGGDPYDGDSWEVGQVVFQRWWFLFDRGVIERSNYWRALRGAEGLRMGFS
ncbi:protein of unknown function (DUF3425) domain containing protein [Naviculisporaceae sp. PSN 640]